jgi:hypothetical protein
LALVAACAGPDVKQRIEGESTSVGTFNTIMESLGIKSASFEDTGEVSMDIADTFALSSDEDARSSAYSYSPLLLEGYDERRVESAPAPSSEPGPFSRLDVSTWFDTAAPVDLSSPQWPASEQIVMSVSSHASDKPESLWSGVTIPEPSFSPEAVTPTVPARGPSGTLQKRRRKKITDLPPEQAAMTRKINRINARRYRAEARLRRQEEEKYLAGLIQRNKVSCSSFTEAAEIF